MPSIQFFRASLYARGALTPETVPRGTASL